MKNVYLYFATFGAAYMFRIIDVPVSWIVSDA
jgi:hypothetical protein